MVLAHGKMMWIRGLGAGRLARGGFGVRVAMTGGTRSVSGTTFMKMCVSVSVCFCMCMWVLCLGDRI